MSGQNHIQNANFKDSTLEHWRAQDVSVKAVDGQKAALLGLQGQMVQKVRSASIKTAKKFQVKCRVKAKAEEPKGGVASFDLAFFCAIDYKSALSDVENAANGDAPRRGPKLYDFNDLADMGRSSDALWMSMSDLPGIKRVHPCTVKALEWTDVSWTIDRSEAGSLIEVSLGVYVQNLAGAQGLWVTNFELLVIA